MAESHSKKDRSKRKLSLTKLAFLVVLLVAVIGFAKIWTERRSQEAQRDSVVSEGTKVVLEKESQETFGPVLARLYRDAFFGVGEINGGYTITVAGYIGEKIDTEDGEKLEVFPFFAGERKKPVAISLMEEDTEVSMIENGQNKTQSFSKVRGKLRKGTPVVFTSYFEDEFEYMLAIRGLEQLNDYILLEYEEEPRIEVSFPSTSLLNIELL